MVNTTISTTIWHLEDMTLFQEFLWFLCTTTIQGPRINFHPYWRCVQYVLYPGTVKGILGQSHFVRGGRLVFWSLIYVDLQKQIGPVPEEALLILEILPEYGISFNKIHILYVLRNIGNEKLTELLSMYRILKCPMISMSIPDFYSFCPGRKW